MVRKSQAGGYLPEWYFDNMAGMVLETSQFFPSTITVSTYPGWALGCPTASCKPKRRNHDIKELAMPVLGMATNPLALTPTCRVLGR